MPFRQPVFRQLQEAKRWDDGCEMCGFRIPALENYGLQVAHIIAEADGGANEVENALVLCHNCAETLDRFLKPKLHTALKRVGLKAPKGWKFAEGRRAKNDDM
jgi:predicted restriction endonuclease